MPTLLTPSLPRFDRVLLLHCFDLGLESGLTKGLDKDLGSPTSRRLSFGDTEPGKGQGSSAPSLDSH